METHQTTAILDEKHETRQAMIQPLGTLIHHMFAHSGVLSKLEGKAENAARREEIIQQVAKMVHERPAKDALNLLIEKHGKDHVQSLLHLSHEFYEGLGEGQTHKLMGLSGLDMTHLQKSADVEHVLANISNVVIAANPTMVNNLLQGTAAKKEEEKKTQQEAVVKETAAKNQKLTAREKESAKTKENKLVDWAYTANHAIFCLITDIPDIFGRWWLNNFESGQKFSDSIVEPFTKYSGLDWLGKQKEKIGELPPFVKVREWVDKKFGHLTEEEREDRAIDKFFNKNKYTQLLREFVAELIGDSIAVPFTVGMQRMFPGLMNGLNKMGEKLQGGMYRKSSQREALKWAADHGLDPNSEEVKAKQKELYEYEVGHLSQAYMWTVSSMFFNAGASKAFGNKSTYGRLVANNVLSALSTFALVTAGRVSFPSKATQADAWTKRTFIDPIFGKKKDKQEAAADTPTAAAAEEKPTVMTDRIVASVKEEKSERGNRKTDWRDKTETIEVRREKDISQEAALPV